VEVHVLVVITVSVRLEVPSTTVLELLGNLPPVPVLGHPAQRRSSVSSVNFEQVETRGQTEGSESHGLPEANPFNNLVVFVNSFAVLEAESGIGLHRGSLYEGLELVTGMSRGTLNTDNTFDGFLTEDGVAKTVSNVGPLLLVRHFHLPVVAAIVIVVIGSGAVLKELLVL
jgi:hypothetical protein